MKDKLVRNLVQLIDKELEANLQEVTDSIKCAKSDTETQNMSVIAKINQSFAEFHEVIEQHKQNLLEKASSVAKGKVCQLRTQEKNFTIALHTLQSLVDFVERNIENATDEELMSIHLQIMKRINEETRKCQEIHVDLESVEKADIIFKVGEMEKLRRLCNEEIYLFECSVGKVKDAEVGAPMHVTIAYRSDNHSRADIGANLISSLKGLIVEAKVEITINGILVPGSPFPVIAKIPSHQFCKPQKIIDRFKDPIDIAINSVGEVIVAEQGGRIAVIHKSGRIMHSSIDRDREQGGCLKLEGIAVDYEDNVYVTDNRCGSLFKLNKYCQQIKKVGRDCKGLEDFDPWGVTVLQEQMIVTQSTRPLLNFTRDLQKINFNGNGLGITHDLDKHIYVCSDSCIQVLNSQGEALYSLGNKDSKRLSKPRSVCVDGEYVYVSEWEDNHCVSVFSKGGNFITSFGNSNTEHQFAYPSGLVFNANNILYIYDSQVLLF